MRAAGWLHDAGMEGMRFVARPGPVSPAERRVLETHPLRGYALLAGAQTEPLDTAAVIALSHHERFDGSGYPQRLTGEAIPLVGRIVAVADTFDALTTDRPYRAAGAVEEALVTLRGGQFDPRVVDAFADALEDVLALGREYPDDEGRLISPQEAATLLSLSTSQLRRLADEGRLPVRRTEGGHRRFLLSAVLRLAAETQPRCRSGRSRRRNIRCRGSPSCWRPRAEDSRPPRRPPSTATARRGGSPPRCRPRRCSRPGSRGWPTRARAAATPAR